MKLRSHSQNLRNGGWKECVGSHPSPPSCLRKDYRQHKTRSVISLESLEDIKGWTSHHLSFQCYTTFLIKHNVHFEPSRLKLVTSSLHLLQFLNISVELGGPKAGHSIADGATPVLNKGEKPSVDLLATDVPQSALLMMRTHCWVMFILVPSINPSFFSKGMLLSHRVSSLH